MALLGPTSVKAVCKTLVKLTPDNFRASFDPFWIEQHFLRQFGDLLKIGSSLKPNYN